MSAGISDRDADPTLGKSAARAMFDDQVRRERLLQERYDALHREARALYEQVQMDESVGICLSDRVATLRLGDVLDA